MPLDLNALADAIRQSAIQMDAKRHEHFVIDAAVDLMNSWAEQIQAYVDALPPTPEL